MIIDKEVTPPTGDEGWREFFRKNSSEQRAFRLEIKARLVEYFGGKCTKCQGEFPAICYDFHHRIPRDKLFTISGQQLILHSWEELIEEADKCDLLCSNCHRIVEWGEYKYRPRTKR